MKRFSAILFLVASAGCASAEPPLHNPAAAPSTNALMKIVAPVGVPIDGVIGYGANHSDTNWTRLVYQPATSGQSMALRVPVYDEYTATSTNSLTGQESDYASKVILTTNAPIAAPNISIK